MGTSAENFCLRWNDFESNVSSSFREIRIDADFFDVTLATSDSGSRTLQAHKVILSACSNFFKQILRQQTKIHSHPNPLIYLRGVTHSDLMSVLDFMYHGEVNVAQDDLNSFLAVAEELQIKGLTNKDQPESQAVSKLSRPNPGRVKEPGPPPKRIRKSSPSLPVRTTIPAASAVASTSIELDDDDDIKEVLNVKMDPEGSLLTADPDESVNPDEVPYDDTYGEYYDDESGGMEGDGMEEDPGSGGASDGAKDIFKLDGDQYHSGSSSDQNSSSNEFGIVKLTTGQGKCLTCGKIFSNLHNCRTHYREVHMASSHGEVHLCHICGAKFNFQRSRNNHLRSKHGISQKMLKSAKYVL